MLKNTLLKATRELYRLCTVRTKKISLKVVMSVYSQAVAAAMKFGLTVDFESVKKLETRSALMRTNLIKRAHNVLQEKRLTFTKFCHILRMKGKIMKLITNRNNIGKIDNLKYYLESACKNTEVKIAVAFFTDYKFIEKILENGCSVYLIVH